MTVTTTQKIHVFQRCYPVPLFQTSWLLWTLSLVTVALMPTFCFAYDSSLGLSKLCKARCDNHRTVGWRGAFQLDCNKAYPDSKSQSYCSGQCSECPDSICHLSQPNIFNCPSTDIEGECKHRCDLHRTKAELDGYVLKCDEAYTSESDIEICRRDCDSRQCPKWVCDPSEDRNVFYCPTASYEGPCMQDCEHHRHYTFSDTQDRFTYLCSRFINEGQSAVDKCKAACDNCPIWLCNKDVDRNEWRCPKVGDPIPLPTLPPKLEPEPEYGGNCKARCDKYRLGGTQSYSFKCDELFSTDLEKLLCAKDCESCPRNVCEHPKFEGDKSEFKCPVSDDHREPKPPPSPPPSGGYDSDSSRSSSDDSFLITLIYAVIITVVLIIVSIMYCRKGRNNAGVVAPVPPGGVPMQMQGQQGMYQQQQQQPMYATTSQPSYSSMSTAPPTSASNVQQYYNYNADGKPAQVAT